MDDVLQPSTVAVPSSADMRASRLFTSWGTVLFLDQDSGELRHGPIDDCPANAWLLAQPDAEDFGSQASLMADTSDGRQPLVCVAGRCWTVSCPQAVGEGAAQVAFELVPLERGMLGLRSTDGYLTAQPNGKVTLGTQRCSVWECFLASEDWCTTARGSQDPGRRKTNLSIDWRGIANYIIDPLLRIRSRQTSARKLLIFGHTQWSHGRVYYDVCNALSDRGYVVDLLDWTVGQGWKFARLLSYYDFVISALDGVKVLVDTYGVPYERIIALSHHAMDIRVLIDQKGTGIFERFSGYGVVGYQLYDVSAIFGIPRSPLVVQLGVNVEEFQAEPPKALATVGYASAFTHVNPLGIEMKRGELAEAATREAGLDFKLAGSVGGQTSFHDMPAFYASIDALLVSSITEGAQLPIREAAAAGRLVISTPVGDFPLRASQGCGIVAPIEAHKYTAFVTETLRYYQANPKLFAEKCRNIQTAARQLDWSKMINDWVELIESAARYQLDRALAHQRAGRNAQAAEIFGKWADAALDAEERWYSRWQQSRCLRDDGDPDGFIRKALQAYQERPCRAEPLHDLANHYLSAQQASPAAMYAEAALAIAMPIHDRFGVDPGLYRFGLQHNFAALANWSPNSEQKQRGHQVCEWLALNPAAPSYIRDPARYNLSWYAMAAQTLLPSLQFHPLSVAAPEGFHPGNVGICLDGDRLVAIVRTINWIVEEARWYVLQGEPPYRNELLLLEIDRDFQIQTTATIARPADFPAPLTKDHHGFQDPRPFMWRGQLWCLCASTEHNEKGRAGMVLARVERLSRGEAALTDWRILPSPDPTRDEKNWIPLVQGESLNLIYSTSPTRVLSEAGEILKDVPTPLAASSFRGGSQAVEFSGGWLAIVHEVEYVNGKRRYFHRFVWFDTDLSLKRLSRRFFLRKFDQVGGEFVCGMAWHPDESRLVISFGTNDSDPCLAVVDAADVSRLLVGTDVIASHANEVVANAAARLQAFCKLS